MIGATLKQTYTLVSLLGEGGMGAVYEAVHGASRERVAVKILDDCLHASGPGAVRRFRREARAAGAIDSPHIVRVLDAGEDEATGALYLVMERLAGEDLQRRIRRVGPLRPEAALRIAGQALLGLARAHEAGVVHRDIKPSNLFLALRGDGEVTVKILDFGIAKMKEALGAQHLTDLTRTGDVLGSLLYMSPEQAQSSKHVDHRTDLWSLGGALYCALAGQAPHQNVPPIHATLLAICSSPVRPLRGRAPWVPAEAEGVVRRALEIDPARRYASAEAMIDAIRPLVPGGFSLREEMLVEASPETLAAVRALSDDTITEALG